MSQTPTRKGLECDIMIILATSRLNRERPHQGRGMNDRTPLQAFVEGLPGKPTTDQETEPQPLAA